MDKFGVRKVPTETLVKIGIGLGLGYAIIRGRPLLQRRIVSDKSDDEINVNDTRGKPIMDENWSYKSRERSVNSDGKDKQQDILELSCVPVKPLSSNASCIKQPTVGQNGDDTLDVLIIGGAAAGLSTAACCQKQGLKYLVIEKNENVGDIWMSRYHRLHLHDIIDNCHLPEMDMPTSYPVFPSRKEVASYLEGYKTTLNLKVQTCSVVKHAERIDKNDMNSGWIVTVANMAKDGEIQKLQCRHLVMANGIYGDPKQIQIGDRDKFKGLIVHSSRYTNGTDLGLKGKNVLVVGWGNSGSEIALDLLEHGAKPTLLIRSGQVVVPHTIMMKVEAFPITHLRWMLKIPFGWLIIFPLLLQDIALKIICRLYYGNLKKYGVKIHSKGMMARFLKDGVAPLMDVGTIAAVKDGSIDVINSEIDKCTNDNNVIFKNGETKQYDAIVLATGYEVFSSHKHWLDEDDLKLIGTGKDALEESKISPGGNFKSKLPTLWYCFGNLIMIKLSSQIMVKRIKGIIRNNNELRNSIIKFAMKQILKHILALIAIRKLWLWYKANK